MMALNQAQTDIIKATIPVLAQHGTTICRVFYHNMLRDIPALKSIFSSSHQATGHQAKSLAGALYAYASNIDNLGALGPFIELVCHKHAALSVQPEQYDIVGKYLLAAMGEILGDALTPEILDAWKTAYFQLAKIMIEREKELYASTNGWTSYRKLKIEKRVQETDEITSFYLKTVDGSDLPSFKPGQYITVRVNVEELGFLQPRHYSLSDAPGKDYFRITVKREKAPAGLSDEATKNLALVSNILHDRYHVGDLLEVSHPMGDFFFEAPVTKPSGCPFHQSATEDKQSAPASLVLVSAGVGITPIMAILRSQLQHPTISSRPITFIHGANRASLRAFSADIIALHSEPNADIHTIFFDSNLEKMVNADSPLEAVLNEEHQVFQGRTDLEKAKPVLEERGLKDPDTQFFVCGPESFMQDVSRKLVKDWGVDASKVHLELFGTGGVKEG